MKDKVLLVSPYSQKKVGGIGTWTKNILDYHHQHGKFDLFFLNTAFKFKRNIVKNKYERVVIGIADSCILIFLLVAKTIVVRPRTIHYTSSGSIALIKDYAVAMWAKLTRVKFIIHWRFGRIPELYQQQNIEWKLLIRVAKLSTMSIVLDKKSLELFEKAGIKNVKLIPNPISQNLERLAEDVVSRSEKRLENCILYVGHIIPDKGIRELIKAFCSLEGEPTLILIGPVSLDFKNELRSKLTACNKSHFVKWKGEIAREEVFYYLKTATVLCLPSYTEGFPNVIIEAMAMKCPIIATNVGAIKEMIMSQDMGHAGICIEPKKDDQIIDAVHYILNNKNKALYFGINGNRRVLCKYTLDNVFHQYEELWAS